MRAVALCLLLTAGAAGAQALERYEGDAPVPFARPPVEVLRVVALGSSTTAGAGTTTGSYPARFATLKGTPWTVQNSGVSGDTTAMVRTRWEAPLSGRPFRWLLLHAGTNDCRTGLTAAAALANLQAMAAQARAEGSRVVMMTVWGWEGYGTYTAAMETCRQALNTGILAHCAAGGADVCVDLSTALADPGQPTRLLPAYDSGDHLHANDSGAQRIADLVAAAVAP